MRWGALRHLVRLSIARDPRGSLSSIFGVAMGVGTLVFFVALGSGIGNVVREQVFPVEARLIQVVPPTVSVGALLGGGRLDDAAVEQLAGLQGVVATHRHMDVRVPSVIGFNGDFFGRQLRMGAEVAVEGVEPGLLAAHVDPARFVDAGPEAPMAGVASTRLLEIYNRSFAPSRGLPQLSGRMLEGFTVPIEINRSWVSGRTEGPMIPARVEVVGLSPRAMLAGVTVPLETARRLNAQAGADAETYTAVTLELETPSQVPTVSRQVEAMGWEIDDQDRELARTAGAAVLLTTSVLAFLSLLICLLAAVNIAHALSASVRAREKELGVYRAVGATRAAVKQLVMAEGATLGLLGGAAGVATAFLFAALTDLAVARWVPDFPFKPQTAFAFPWWLWAGGIGLGVLAALVGSFGPARRAAATDPARVLAG